MNWLFLALLAPAIYSIVTFIDKYIVTREVKDYNAMPIYTGIVALLAGSLFWIATGFPILTFRDASIVILTGFITAWMTILYYKAISIEDTSVINILFQMFPVMTMILSSIFLKEQISTIQFIGFILVLSASVLITLRRDKSKFHVSTAFYLMLLTDLFWAISGILMKYSLNVNSLSKIISYESFGIALGAAVIFILVNPVRKAFKRSIKTVSKRGLRVIFLNEVVFITAKSITFFAFTLGPVALVSVLENTQVFYAIILGIFLTRLFPGVFHEKIKRSEITKKISAALILFIGIYLINQ